MSKLTKGRKPVDTEADPAARSGMDPSRYQRAMDLIQIAALCGFLPKISPEDRASLLQASGSETPFTKRLQEALLDASRIHEIAAQTPIKQDGAASREGNPAVQATPPLAATIRHAWDEIISSHPLSVSRAEAMASLNYQNEWCFIRFLTMYRYPYPKAFEMNAKALRILRELHKIAGALGGRGRTYNHRAGRKIHPQSTSDVVTEEWLAKQISEGLFRPMEQTDPA